MNKKILFAMLGYMLVTLALGVSWHFALFPEIYRGFGIYNRAEMSFPLGMLSMVLQGGVMAVIYPRWYRGEAPLVAGLKFGLLMGVFLFSVSTTANAAKINVNGLASFMILQAAFHTVQFAAAGAVFGFIFGRVEPGSRLSTGENRRSGIELTAR